MLIQKNNAPIKNMPNCAVAEYEFHSKNLGIARVSIDGRYPEVGKATNTACDMIYYITAGSGTIHTAKGSFEVQTGDAYFFEKGTWYWMKGKKVELALVTAPNWYPEQYTVEE